VNRCKQGVALMPRLTPEVLIFLGIVLCSLIFSEVPPALWIGPY
jgi:hypothetical protein